MKKLIAEFVGAFGLTFAVGLSLAGSFPVATAVVAAVTLGLFVYTVGAISGAHLNPAITLGLWSIKKIRAQEAAYYIVAQLLGGALALFLIGALATPAALVAGNSMHIMLAELIGAFFFGFGVAAVASQKVPAALSGLVVGGSLLLGIALAASLNSNGILNPAVALGIGSFTLAYIIGPIIGAILGMQVLKALYGDR